LVYKKTGRHGAKTLVIHHADEDQSNNSPENLKPGHHGCHTIHHRKGKPGNRKGREFSAEHCRKLSVAATGRKHTEVTKAKIKRSLTNSREK
jgi:hypothetical protein